VSRFNSTATKGVQTVKNHGGADSYKLSKEVELYSVVCNSLITDKYYESGDSQLARIIELVKDCDPVFVANLASYARNEMNLRTVPVVLSTLLCRNVGGSVAKDAVFRTVKRADEITEVLGYFAQLNKDNWKKISEKGHIKTKKMSKYSHSLKRGIAKVFESGRFDRYQFSKYNRQREFSFKDALFLCNPKPQNDEMAELFKLIASDELGSADTWEAKQSALGQENKEKSEDEAKVSKLEVWKEMIANKKLGHMALLRNLNNILKCKPDSAFMDDVCRELVRGAKKSKQFPFRYWSAYKTLQKDHGHHSDPFLFQKVSDALEQAIRDSIKSMSKFDGNTLIACDVSGSMVTPVSDKSIIQNIDIGLVLGCLLKNVQKLNTILGVFGDEFKIITGIGNGVLADVRSSFDWSHKVGWSTMGYKVIEYLNKRNLDVNQVLVFTDCQVYGSAGNGYYSNGNEMERQWSIYKSKHPNAKLYMFDLSGYGNVPLRLDKGDVIHVAGWSDRIFEAVEYLRKGSDAVDMIMNYTR